jgi:type II secretory pathway predicted ATPase ExeA
MTLWEEKLGKDQRIENYLQKWGLKQDPFAPELPTPEAFVPTQKENLLKLKQALMEGKVVILTGELGMGKTTVCDFLTAALREESILTTDPEKQVIPVLVHGAAYRSSTEFLRAVILALELDAERDPAILFENLRKWGIEHREKLAIIVDDIPESTADFQEMGEFLRVLADLPRISLLLNGEFKRMGGFLKKIPALNDRIQLHVMLGPLDAAGIRELLQLRLKYAGQTTQEGMITPDGYDAIHRLSGGIPRLSLKITSKALHLAAELDSSINAEIVKKTSKRSILKKLFRFL